MGYLCPVCGYKGLERKPYDICDKGYWSCGSLDICDCCGFQFGYDDDDQGFSFTQWRAEWIAEGMPWRSCNPESRRKKAGPDQLARIDYSIERPLRTLEESPALSFCDYFYPEPKWPRKKVKRPKQRGAR